MLMRHPSKIHEHSATVVSHDLGYSEEAGIFGEQLCPNCTANLRIPLKKPLATKEIFVHSEDQFTSFSDKTTVGKLLIRFSSANHNTAMMPDALLVDSEMLKHEMERNPHAPSRFLENNFTSREYIWPRVKTVANISHDILIARANKPAIKNTGFHDLEADILLLIFMNISEQELARSVCGVCRHWYRVGRNSRLWKKLEFKAGKTETSTTCDLLRKSPNLEYLSLNNVENLATIIRQMCRSNRRVKRVKIKNCREGETGKNIPDSVLCNILHSCLFLESLHLKGTQFSSTRFYHELANLPMLRELNLSDNKHLCAKNLASIALNCRRLESISITNERGGPNLPEIADEDVVFFFQTLSDSLRRIEFDARGLGARSFQAILSCRNLERLGLRHALLLTGETFRSYVSKLCNLQRLRLTHARQLLSDDFIFVDDKHAFDHLTFLDLTGCSGIRDIGLKTLLSSCGDKLTRLSLESCKSLSDFDIVVDNCSKLRYLNIAHAFPSHATCIRNLPLKIPRLRKLVIDEKIISDRDLTALRSRAPELTMIRSMSEFHSNRATLYPNKDN